MGAPSELRLVCSHSIKLKTTEYLYQFIVENVEVFVEQRNKSESYVAVAVYNSVKAHTKYGYWNVSMYTRKIFIQKKNSLTCFPLACLKWNKKNAFE